ncbi:MAG TPA: dTDP-glucose 4,6-dehydratase [Candidatus Tumulicola sp.]|nr:dTDP-glucose 4,6-dehydratase [Candidatus Tumulicola sp.]
MRLLITGGCGFIGSNFIRAALKQHADWSVVNLDALTYAGNERNLRDVEGDTRYRFVHGDICDPADVRSSLGEGVHAIVNFAAETHVDRSITSPEAFLRTDVLGTHVLLEAARECKVGRFVQVSTDEVYGSVPHGRTPEGAPLAPRSPYAASKAGADLLVLAYVETYALPAIITRGSNTYGPYQHPEKLVPLFVTNLIDRRPVPLYGDGLHEREWLHVDDHCSAIEHALLHGVRGEVYNVGPHAGCTNLEMTQRLLALLGLDAGPYVRRVPDRPGHDRRYALDCSKLLALGWSPRVELASGLAQTVAWYRANETWWRPIVEGEFASYYRRQYSTLESQ